MPNLILAGTGQPNRVRLLNCQLTISALGTGPKPRRYITIIQHQLTTDVTGIRTNAVAGRENKTRDHEISMTGDNSSQMQSAQKVANISSVSLWHSIKDQTC
jgi:hypothetical protein